MKMKRLDKTIKPATILLALLMLGTSPFALAASWGNNTEASAATEDPNTQVFDTSFAVEFSYSCLSGGCHETNTQLVDEYAASTMTHTMVKCNACHGTHTADTVGLEKPNLTGYYPGIGASGYKVDTDRCKTCHNNEHSNSGRRKSSDDCYSCHAPHVFGAGGG
jgi:hypothetical protein